MRSKIKERLQQIKNMRADVMREPTKYVDKSSSDLAKNTLNDVIRFVRYFHFCDMYVIFLSQFELFEKLFEKLK